MKVQDLPNAAIVLAAGASRRMGRAKPLLPLDGGTLLSAHIQALHGRSERVIVVLGRDAEGVARTLPPEVQVVRNPRWEHTWPADSLRLALVRGEVEGCCWVTPVDTPPAAPDTLDALLAAGAPAVPVDAEGRSGHPVLIGPAQVAQLRDRAPDGGLRTLLGEAHRAPVADPLVSWDFDTPAAWRAFLAARSP